MQKKADDWLSPVAPESWIPRGTWQEFDGSEFGVCQNFCLSVCNYVWPRQVPRMADKITRIAIVDANRCKPKRCAQECKKVRLKLCIRHENDLLTHIAVMSCGEDG